LIDASVDDAGLGESNRHDNHPDKASGGGDAGPSPDVSRRGDQIRRL
jgi:hypothetical protein